MSSSSQVRQAVANRYGRVLFEMACDENVLGATLKDVKTLTDLLSSDESEWKILTNPTISREEQEQVITSLSRALSLKDLTTRFLQVLSFNGRLSYLYEVLKVFYLVHEEAMGKVSGTIETARSLKKDEIQSLEKKLSQEMEKEVTLTELVNPELLGGAILRVSAVMVDASVGSRLSKLKTVMMKG